MDILGGNLPWSTMLMDCLETRTVQLGQGEMQNLFIGQAGPDIKEVMLTDFVKSPQVALLK